MWRAREHSVALTGAGAQTVVHTSHLRFSRGAYVSIYIYTNIQYSIPIAAVVLKWVGRNPHRS